MKSQRSETHHLLTSLAVLQRLRQGEVSLRINAIESLQLTIENDKIHLNFLQREHLKALLQLEPEMEKESIFQKLIALKKMAENLREKGFTIIISYKNRKILTLGYAAKPTISQIVTETNAIEVNNLVELLKLIK
jgi:hypothetical protein